jgi:hypothetical protein
MIDIETITQIANNINEAKDALLLAREDRADIVEDIIAIVLAEEEIEPELVDKLRVIEHEIDLADESIEANKNMLIAIIDGEDIEGEDE